MWDLFSVQRGLVLEVTVLLCWLIPRVVTGGCASITACDSVAVTGNLLVSLKLFSVKGFLFLFLTCRQPTVKPVVVFRTSCGKEALPTLVL